jgi:two-component system chemotaxis response regulator CheY
MKFLVVDDSVTMRRIIINSLQRIGYNDIVEASDGQEALGRFDASIEFIITDWNMPNMSGIDFARAVRKHALGAKLPILMVTTRSVREDIVTAVEAGVNNYVLKPFTPQVLKEKIDQVLTALSGAAAA